MTRKRIKYPQALVIAKRRDANLWMLGDQLLADMGKPPRFFTTCHDGSWMHSPIKRTTPS
jgi:hypothetical protein